jgi:hypothetical protein
MDIVFARMPEADVSLIKKICILRGENLSVFVRRSVYRELSRLSYLDKASEKALKVK